jgi:hypothetical protein
MLNHRQFHAARLMRHQVDQAYPLVQLMSPSVDLARWRAYARWHMRFPAQQGILIVSDSVGHIFGIANFRRQWELEQDPVLVSDRFIGVDLVDPAEINALLISALDRIAVDFGCSAIHAYESQIGIGASADQKPIIKKCTLMTRN